VAEAIEVTGSRVAKTVDSANDGVGRLRAQAGDRIGQVGNRWGSRSAKLRVGGFFSNSKAATRRRTKAAALPLELAETSRELAHETSDLGEAVASLNAVIKANRQDAAKTRSRLFVGIGIGAALAYHLDSEHGRQRRAATARLVTSAVRNGLTKARAAVGARGASGTRRA
jgi:hypothetical protein